MLQSKVKSLDRILSAVFKPVGIIAAGSILTFSQISAQSYGVLRGNATLQNGVAPVTNLELILTNVNNPSIADTLYSDSTGGFLFDDVSLKIMGDEKPPIPGGFELWQSYPNSFSDRATIEYQVPLATQYSLKIYDLKGRFVRELSSGQLQPGRYRAVWDGKDRFGEKTSDGFYLYTLETPYNVLTGKAIKLSTGPVRIHSASGSTYRPKTTGNNPVIHEHNGRPIQSANQNTARKTLVEAYTLEARNIEATQPKIIPAIFNVNVEGDTTTYNIMLVRNSIPSISNLSLSPMNPIPGDTIKVLYDYSDADGDPDSSLIAIYINSQLAQQGLSKLLLPGQTIGADSVRAIVIPNDGREYGQPDTSGYVVVTVPVRTINLNVQDYFLRQSVDSMFVVTSKDSGYTNQNGDISLQASTDREDITLVSPNHMLSGVILPASLSNTVLTHYVANKDTANQGIDEWYFGEYFLKKADSSMDGIYLAMTQESVPDTAFIGGDIVRQSDGFHVSYGWNSVAQLNAIAQVLNEEAEQYTTVRVPEADSTYTLYSVNNTVIAIADSNFNHADSIAQFAYPNMVVVSQDLFPPFTYEGFKRKTTIRSTTSGTGYNGTFYDHPNRPTLVIGNQIKLQILLTLGAISSIMSSEFYPSIIGEVESDIGYPSIIDTQGGVGDPNSHDQRMMIWNIFRGPDHRFPDLPAGFNPQIANRYLNRN